MNKEIEKLIQADSISWATYKQLQLTDGITFSIKDMPYLADLINCDKRVMNVKKGTQVCMTTTKFLEAVHACLYRKYTQNVIYMMPTVKTVERLAKISFDPIFDYNPWLKKKLGTNTASIKEINGRSIVFIGAQPQKVAGQTKDSANLRSTPADCIMRDEIDLMDEDMVEMSKQRLNRSLFRIEVNFGSPTFPGWGIDALYEASDQRKWQQKCNSCNKYTCLVQDFPNSIILKNGVWIRACVHCQAELFIHSGKWIADYSDRREAGFWVDGLISPYADLEEYMYRYHNTEGTKHSEFLRSILGIAATEAENQLTEQDVMNCCTGQPIEMYSTGETVMGVDVGDVLHVIIGIRTGRDTYDIMYIGRVKDFKELHKIAEHMNVKYCVIDALPDIHATRQFAKEESYAIARCHYSEQMPGKPNFDSKMGTVKVNRNEWCDKVHEVVVMKKIRIPWQCHEIDKYAHEMTKTAKTIFEHPETGIPRPKWIKLSGGDDHYYHTTLYFLLAASRVSPRSREGRNERHTKQKCEYIMGRKVR